MDWLLGWDLTCGLWKKNIKASAFGWTWESFVTEHGESKTFLGENPSSQIGGLGLPLLIQASCPAPYAAAILASSIDRATASDTLRAPRCFAWPSLCCSDLNFWGILISRALQFWRERKFGTPMAHCLWSDIKLYSVVKVYLPIYLSISPSDCIQDIWYIFIHYYRLSTALLHTHTHIYICIYIYINNYITSSSGFPRQTRCWGSSPWLRLRSGRSSLQDPPASGTTDTRRRSWAASQL